MIDESAEVILRSLERLSAVEGGPVAFSDLTVDVWRSAPDAFCLANVPAHPDSRKVLAYLQGELSASDFIFMISDEEIELTPKGALAVRISTLRDTIETNASSPGFESGSNFPIASMPTLQRALNQVTEREWEVLAGRFGLTTMRTLAEVGEAFGISRERVRQIQSAGLDKLHKFVTIEIAILHTLEDRAARLDMNTAVGITAESAMAAFAPEFEVAADSDEIRTVRQLLIGMRALCSHKSYDTAAIAQFPALTALACAVQPVITDHPVIALQVAELAEEHRTWTYEELAIAVLREAGEPLHWRDIAERANLLDHKDQVRSPVLLNMLNAKPDVFARTDAGTYGLVEWGLSNVEFYPDIIARILSDAGYPLDGESIIQEVLECRPGKPQSLQMFLDTHPRFYRSGAGSYGLRAWLEIWQSRLDTLDDFQESEPSARRIQRNSASGYNVDRIVEFDR